LALWTRTRRKKEGSGEAAAGITGDVRGTEAADTPKTKI
jgi:hypothetical protein